MSTEKGSGEKVTKQEGTRTPPPPGKSPSQKSGEPESNQSKPTLTHEQKLQITHSDATQQIQKQSSPQSIPSSTPVYVANASASSSISSGAQSEGSPPRQVIAVSASKGPAAFFNLARKFLATDEMCDLSALEGAIVSAVDAAHLLERSQLATIVRVNTSYVTVEPKRRKLTSEAKEQEEEEGSQTTDTIQATGSPKMAPAVPTPDSKPPAQTSRTQSESATKSSVFANSPRGRPAGRELRRARIVITVRRTESYKRWLEENPLQAIIASEENVDAALAEAPGSHK